MERYCIGAPHDVPERLDNGTTCNEACNPVTDVFEGTSIDAHAALDQRWEQHVFEFYGLEYGKDVVTIARLGQRPSRGCARQSATPCDGTPSVRLTFSDLREEDRCNRHSPVTFVSNEATCDRLTDGVRCGALAEISIAISATDPTERVTRCAEHAEMLDGYGINVCLEREFDSKDNYWYYRQESLADSQRAELKRPKRKPRIPPLPTSVQPRDPAHYRDVIFAKSCEDLGDIPDKVVQLLCTSPPYFKKIFYGYNQPDATTRTPQHSTEIGWEATAGQYVRRLVHLARGWWRILADDGVLVVNIGETMANDWACVRMDGVKTNMTAAKKEERFDRLSDDFKNKDAMTIPFLLAHALRKDGWYLRGEVIWDKHRSGKPEPHQDRLRLAHEYLFVFAKSEKYTFARNAMPDYAHSSVWVVPTEHVNGEHQAPMPIDLVTPWILGATQPGQLVCDPFMGSGTVAVAARKLGRAYCGYELYGANRDLIARRLASEGGIPWTPPANDADPTAKPSTVARPPQDQLSLLSA